MHANAQMHMHMCMSALVHACTLMHALTLTHTHMPTYVIIIFVILLVSLKLKATGCEHNCMEYADNTTCSSSIIVNGKEKSPKKDGFNILVIDNFSGHMTSAHFLWSSSLDDSKSLPNYKKFHTFFNRIKSSSIIIILFQNMCDYFHQEWYKFLTQHADVKLIHLNKSTYYIAILVACKISCPKVSKGAIPYSYSGPHSQREHTTLISFRLRSKLLVYLFICLFVYLFICLFVYSFIRLFGEGVLQWTQGGGGITIITWSKGSGFLFEGKLDIHGTMGADFKAAYNIMIIYKNHQHKLITVTKISLNAKFYIFLSHSYQPGPLLTLGVTMTSPWGSNYRWFVKIIIIDEFLIPKLVQMQSFIFFISLNYQVIDHGALSTLGSQWRLTGGHILWIWTFWQDFQLLHDKRRLWSNFHVYWQI